MTQHTPTFLREGIKCSDDSTGNFLSSYSPPNRPMGPMPKYKRTATTMITITPTQIILVLADRLHMAKRAFLAVVRYTSAWSFITPAQSETGNWQRSAHCLCFLIPCRKSLKSHIGAGTAKQCPGLQTDGYQKDRLRPTLHWLGSLLRLVPRAKDAFNHDEKESTSY